MKISHLNSKRALTLAEVIVTVGIFSVILGLLYGIFIAGNDMFQVARDESDLQAEARRALMYMTRELKNATRTSAQNPSPNLSIPSHPNNKHVEFCLPEDKDDDGYITDSDGETEWNTNDKIQYQYIPGQQILRRLHKGDHLTLANDVTDVQFIDNDIDGSLPLTELQIVITITKTTSSNRVITFTLSSIVRLRN